MAIGQISNGESGSSCRSKLNAALTVIDNAAPGLPVWTYTAGAMAAGKFKTDSANIDSTSYIDLSYDPVNGAEDFAANFVYYKKPFFVILTDGDGESIQFRVDTVEDRELSTVIRLSGAWIYPYSGLWSGAYQFSVGGLFDFTYISSVNGSDGPAITIVPPDTGWVANADVGSKTSAIPAMPDTSGLEALSSGFSAWAEAMDDKLKALQEALATNLRPNA